MFAPYLQLDIQNSIGPNSELSLLATSYAINFLSFVSIQPTSFVVFTYKGHEFLSQTALKFCRKTGTRFGAWRDLHNFGMVNQMNDRYCEEKLHLFQYRKAANRYSASIALMAEMSGGLLAKAEFSWLSEATSQAHEKCIEAREHFFKHTKEHGCDWTSFVETPGL